MYPCVEALISELRSSKEEIIAEDGIGTDMAPLIVAFDGDDCLIGFAQLQVPPGTTAMQAAHLGSACSLMRSGWHARSLAVVVEVFVDVTNLHDDGDDLPQRYAAGDPDVLECLRVAWFADDGRSALAVLPYALGLGRQVTWLTERDLVMTDLAPERAFLGLMSSIFQQVPMVPYPPNVPVELLTLAIAREIIDLGFVVGYASLGAAGSDHATRSP